MSTLFAPVAPIHTLRKLTETQLLGSYQLVIAPVILKQDVEYAALFAEWPSQFIILDNGIIELGFPLHARLLDHAARVVNANVVVMPDTIDDGRMTIKQTRQALKDFRKVDRSTDTMGVVQGKTYEECHECAKSLIEEGVDWLGVPRGLTPHLGTRTELVIQLYQEYPTVPLHILGFSDNIMDDILATVAAPTVKGLDSATPTWYQKRLPLTPPTYAEDTLRIKRRPADFWTAPTPEAAPYNVEIVRRWLHVAQDALTESLAAGEKKEPAAQADL